MSKKTKISVVGCGRVGTTAAYTMYLRNTINEIVLFDRNQEKIAAERLDFMQSLSFLGTTRVNVAASPADLKDSDVIIYAAGVAQGPKETRLDLMKKNVAILESTLPEILESSPDSIVIIVSNPVDILTWKAYDIAKIQRGKIFGSGTTLDTARFRYYLSETLKINPANVHGYILGEHGDSSFPVVSTVSVGDEPIGVLTHGYSKEIIMDAYKKARDAAYAIIAGMGATYYSIAVVVDRLVDACLNDSKMIFPVSVPLEGEYGINNVSLSVPCVLGAGGVEKVIELNLSAEEKKMMKASVETLSQYLTT